MHVGVVDEKPVMGVHDIFVGTGVNAVINKVPIISANADVSAVVVNVTV